jgi:hypothetical protein
MLTSGPRGSRRCNHHYPVEHGPPIYNAFKGPAWSCPCPLRINTAGSSGDRQKIKKFYKEDHHDVTTALCTVVTPSKPPVQTHVATSGDLPLLFPPTTLTHLPAGCGHGGTRKHSTSRSVQT